MQGGQSGRGGSWRRRLKFFSEIDSGVFQDRTVCPFVPKALPLHQHCPGRGISTFVSTVGSVEDAVGIALLARTLPSKLRRSTNSEASSAFPAPSGTEEASAKVDEMAMDIREGSHAWGRRPGASSSCNVLVHLAGGAGRSVRPPWPRQVSLSVYESLGTILCTDGPLPVISWSPGCAT